MIPKTIHYCWFGRNSKPKLAEKCIKSWKKYCKDYEIIEWNEDNFDINSNAFVKEAYEAKKWAFVTDYVRLWAMYNYGGIYMDTDVEVIKPLDKFLHHDAFSGFEDETHIPTGIMASEKNGSVIGLLLGEYKDKHFIKSDGTFDLTTNVTLITDQLSKYGFVPNNSHQCVEGFVLYPKDYFCPKNYQTDEIEKTKNTHTIHHFTASWQSAETKKAHKKRIAEIRRTQRKDYIVHIPNRILLQLLGSERYEKLKKKLKNQ